MSNQIPAPLSIGGGVTPAGATTPLLAEQFSAPLSAGPSSPGLLGGLPLPTRSGSVSLQSGMTPTQALEAYKKKDTSKVLVRFKAIGQAPIMKNNYARINAFNKFQAVIQYLRKELGWKPSDALFLYINSSFSPAPDDTVGNLFRCFGTEGHLIVNYSSTAAWG